MQERERDKLGGDIPGPTEGDFSFTDWDNPEDELEEEPEDDWEDAPEGYYDEEEPDDGFGLDPEDPDFDLSEGAGYAGYDSDKPVGIPQWMIVAVSLLLILAILLPALIRFSR